MPLTNQYFLTTKRLGFRRWTMADLPLAFALWSDPQVTALIGGPLSGEQVEQKLATEIASMEQSNVQYWPIFELATGQPVGCAGLRPYRPVEQIYELGFHLRPPFWGKGLAEEAGRAVIDFAFAKLCARGLFAGHHPANAASRRVLQKLGFRFTHEEFYPPTGLKHPSYLLARPTAQPTR
jgi:[ribosomal protein S5]-alanine N-acetyltransferase